MRYSNSTLKSLGDMLKPKEVGEVVNSHVLDYAREPKPDFDQMRDIVSSHSPDLKNATSGEPRKPVSKN